MKQASIPHQSIRQRLPLAAAMLTTVLMTTQLSACFPVVVAGFAAGTLAAIDRRTLGAQTDDTAIELRAENRFRERLGDSAHIAATSYNRKVLLTGEVSNQTVKDEAEKIAAGIENVLGVINELEITNTGSFGSRSNDVLITTKVRATFIDAKDIYASAFKVQTDRGNVYLMGRVTEREGARAAELVRGISGVQKVVKVFDYITEDELKQLSVTKAPAEPQR